MVKEKMNDGKSSRAEDYYGILKCPSCGEYAHFIIVEDFRNSLNLHQMNPSGGIRDLFLVCDSCRMSFFYPPEDRINDLRKLKRRGGFLDYVTTKEVWNSFIAMSDEFILEHVELDAGEAVEFLMNCLAKAKRKFGANNNYDRVFSAFFGWFCDQYGIETDEEMCINAEEEPQQEPAASVGNPQCSKTLFA